MHLTHPSTFLALVIGSIADRQPEDRTLAAPRRVPVGRRIVAPGDTSEAGGPQQGERPRPYWSARRRRRSSFDCGLGRGVPPATLPSNEGLFDSGLQAG